MITIEGTRYISAKTYADLHKLSPSRVSQLKSSLPTQYFEEINMDLINFDLLELSDEVRTAAEQKIATRESLPSYSAGQLGDYFIALITRLTAQASMADQLRLEAEAALRQAQETLQQQQDSSARLQTELTQTSEKLTQAQREFERQSQENLTLLDAATNQNHTLNEQLKMLTAEKSGLEIALKTIESILERQNPRDDTKYDLASVKKKRGDKAGKKAN